MRAAFCTGYGAPHDVLCVVDDAPEPTPRSGDLLIRVRAASLNRIDARKRAGYGRALFELRRKPTFPWILGSDCCGIVEAVGASARGFSVGDRVIAAQDAFRPGTHAALATVRAADSALAPPGLSDAEAASLPYAALTAWRAAGKGAQRGNGRLAFVNGASGGVGMLAVQMLAAWGWRVAATARADAHAALHGFGVETCIDYTQEDFAKRLSAVELVIDAVGESVAGMEARALSILKRGGRYATLVHSLAATLDRFGAPLGVPAAGASLARRKFANRHLDYQWVVVKPDGAALLEIARMAETGAVRPVLDMVAPLDDIADAHDRMEAGGARGKIVLTLAPD